MSDHYCCKRCGLRECICFIEDIPEAPYYHDKYCIRGPMYEILSGKDLPKQTTFQLYGEKWYNSREEAQTARLAMLKLEKTRLEARIQYLDKEISA